jgi:hypothetical protein
MGQQQHWCLLSLYLWLYSVKLASRNGGGANRTLVGSQPSGLSALLSVAPVGFAAPDFVAWKLLALVEIWLVGQICVCGKTRDTHRFRTSRSGTSRSEISRGQHQSTTLYQVEGTGLVKHDLAQ